MRDRSPKAAHPIGLFVQLLILCCWLAGPVCAQRRTTPQHTPQHTPHQTPPTPPPLPSPVPAPAPSLTLSPVVHESPPRPLSNATHPAILTPDSPCSFEPALCRPGTFHLLRFNSDGCPVDSCELCQPETAAGDRTECSGAVDCPTLVAPVQGCPHGQFLNATLDIADCPLLACASCTPELAGLRPGCRHRCEPSTGALLTCPVGQFVRLVNDSRGCPARSCAACDGATAGPAGQPECRGDSRGGCTEANKPRCPGDRRPLQQLLGAACHWVCEPCPADQRQPAGCPAGQYMRDNPAGHCLPWTCRDCDYQHRDLPACRLPEAEATAACPQLDWAVACTAGQFRRARVIRQSGCMAVECARCADESNATFILPAHATAAAAAATAVFELPEECRRPCPEPLVLCGPGTTVEFGLDAAGCRTAVCRLCRNQEACGAQPGCATRRQLDHEHDDCRPGYFYLGDARIDGCAASVCLPCPAGGGADVAARRPPGCSQQLPAACAAVSATVGLPNCTSGAQRVEQVVDATGCPRLACAECPASRPACPAGTRESPRPTKWLQCQLFDCREPPVAVSKATARSADSQPQSPIQLDASGCPEQRWRQSPAEFGTEWIQLEGNCRLRRYRTCPAPAIVCRRGEAPQLLPSAGGGTCEHACQQQNWTSGPEACFPGQHYLLFLIDTNRVKSPFQIRFQVASFIAHLARQLTYGPQAVQIGALCYGGRVLSVISPDEATSPDAFFRRLLLLRYDEDSATATGEAVAAAAQLLRGLKRPAAKRSLIVLTDSVTSIGRSLLAASALLPADTVTYFVSLSSVWNPALRLEAESFVSEPGNFVELTSYYLLSTSGVQLLFPQCHRACDSARSSLAVQQGFLRYLQDSVHSYEAWLYEVYTTIVQLQDGLETMQYQFESKQIRLELCSRMISNYKATVQRLQEQLDSLQVIRTEAVSVVDYESSLAQVKQLEQRIESLTVKKSQLVTQLQGILVQISSAEDRVAALRKEQEEKLNAEDRQIATLEARVAASWTTLQTLTQELLLKRMSASNVEATVQEKETRIQEVLLLNSDLATRISSLEVKISSLKASTNNSQVTSYIQIQQTLSSCEARAALEGFSPLLTVRAGSGVRTQEVLDALLRGASFGWINDSADTAEMQQFDSLINFTIGTYSEVKLLFRNSVGQTRAYLTFRAAAFDLSDFFDAGNLIACFPWRLESVKEALDDLSWSLRSVRFPSLLFSILLPTPAPDASTSNCAGRKGLLALVTDRDGCEDLAGPYPRMRFSPSGQPTALAEMEDLDSLQLLAKPLAAVGTDANWLQGVVASADMPVTLGELLSNGMLAYPPESAPMALRPGMFYKSLLFRTRAAAFPMIRLRLTDRHGHVQQLVFNGTFERDRVVTSTWSRSLLDSARVFAVDPTPFGFTIGDAGPCDRSGNATGVLFFNPDNRCPAAADPAHGWAVLVSPDPDRQVAWTQAERAEYVEILLRRRDSLASAAATAGKAA